MDFPVENLKNWFLQNKRELPWRYNPTPYGVWISEVMLQQTQVSVVTPYFLRWMELFPTVHDLAESSEEGVLKAWEGLGYYSRVKNLHQGAKKVVLDFQGKIPDNQKDLTTIKGLGSYTVAAILAFAFKQRSVPIDSNVARVICRYFQIEIPVESIEAKKLIEDKIHAFLPEKKPWVISEALIELGALICMKKPKCMLCPLRKGCLAFRHQNQDSLPKKKARAPTIYLNKHVGVIFFQDKVLLDKGGQKGRVLSDLFEFPSIEGPSDFSMHVAKELLENKYSLKLKAIAPLPRERQSYTRYQVSLFPYLFSCEQVDEGNLSLAWKKREDLFLLTFSSGHKRIMKAL